jgi:hypothetical protein
MGDQKVKSEQRTYDGKWSKSRLRRDTYSPMRDQQGASEHRMYDKKWR